ncbi:hypothetical protein FACS1894120_5210 [Clostridia bacterium]|nr:hypothetical protein FACS1894120_5210 [Clostridia bacterium]
MATSWLKPLHTGKNRTIASAIKARLAYVKNPEKTENGKLVTSYQCDPEFADLQFLAAKKQYEYNTGRSQGKHDIIAYHVRQSFKPGEITAEEANRIGYELAMRFTKGRFAFLVCTHVDKAHIHSHIVFNSTDLECKRKFQNVFNTSKILRRLSDQICLENGLSVIENPSAYTPQMYELFGDNRITWKEKLAKLIDYLIPKVNSYDELLTELQSKHCEVKRGKYVAVRLDGQKKFTRLKSLGDDYSETALREKIANKTAVPKQTKRVNLLIDLQTAMQKGVGYQVFSKRFNLKEAAKTVLFLQERGFDSLEKLSEALAAAKTKFDGISTTIQTADERLTAIANLQKSIANYARTRDVFAEYKRGGYSKKFYAEHANEIEKHLSAKKEFEKFKGEKIPTIGELKQQYAAIIAEKKSAFAEYKSSRDTLTELQKAQKNVEQILSGEFNRATAEPER